MNYLDQPFHEVAPPATCWGFFGGYTCDNGNAVEHDGELCEECAKAKAEMETN